MTEQETKKVRVRILVDDDPMNPRDWDNVGTMACWHRRHNLGDQQPKCDSREYLQELATDRSDRLGDLLDYWENEGLEKLEEKYDDFHVAEQEAEKHRQELIQFVLDREYVILPLFVYEHGGITMATGPFSCPWDSGQVGYIWCSLEKARRESAADTEQEKTWGSILEANEYVPRETLRERTIRHLKSEVEVYAQWLEGDVYGFIVEEKARCDKCGNTEWEHVDSCFGFYGSDPETNGMADHLTPEQLKLAKQAEIEYR